MLIHDCQILVGYLFQYLVNLTECSDAVFLLSIYILCYILSLPETYQGLQSKSYP